MKALSPHEDLDTVCDALAVALGHLIQTGALEVNEDALEAIVMRAEQYDEDEFAALIETAMRIMGRASLKH